MLQVTTSNLKPESSSQLIVDTVSDLFFIIGRDVTVMTDIPHFLPVSAVREYPTRRTNPNYGYQNCLREIYSPSLPGFNYL
jgi:hypothetical protein